MCRSNSWQDVQAWSNVCLQSLWLRGDVFGFGCESLLMRLSETSGAGVIRLLTLYSVSAGELWRDRLSLAVCISLHARAHVQGDSSPAICFHWLTVGGQAEGDWEEDWQLWILELKWKSLFRLKENTQCLLVRIWNYTLAIQAKKTCDDSWIIQKSHHPTQLWKTV